MIEDTSTIYSQLARGLRGDQLRRRETLVPPAFQVLWHVIRFLVLYGGRSAGKSWSIARVLLVMGSEQPLRILCCREIQGSIKESAYRLLCDQIQALQLDDHYDVQADRIIGRNGTVFYFEGLRYNASKIRSYEGCDVVWLEEAQTVSDMSLETLLPTIRKKGSRFFISFNPMTRDDPVLKRFVEGKRPDVLAKKVSWRDNPHMSVEATAEKDWLERTDPDAYRHVWEGEPRTVSDALILRGKFEVADFEVRADWAGPYHGCDFGFARDPSAAIRCWVADVERALYVDREWWQLACDIDAMPGALESAIPGLSRHTLYCDAARPETVSYLQRNGVARAVSAEKWSGSVDDGIAYLRGFTRIVIDPRCKHFLDECNTYSFKTDRLTGVPLPEPEDKNNHCIDALRYALSPLIRNQPTGGYFSRAALLVNGESLDPPAAAGRPRRVFITMAITERSGTGIGAVTWLYSPHHGWPLVLVDYDLIEIEQLNAEWLRGLYARAQELRAAWDCLEPVTRIWIEEGPGQLYEAVEMLLVEELLPFDPACRPGGTPLTDLARVDPRQLINAQKLPLATLDARAETLRADVNSARLVKFARSAYTRQVTHRSDSANHLVTQLLGYRPNARAAPQELVAAFTFGCLLTRLEGRTPLSAPESQAPAGVPINRPPPLAPSDWLWQTATGCWREGPVPADHKGAVARRGDLGF